MKPLILIPCPTSFDEPYNQQCWPEYATAVTQSGGEPKLVSLQDPETSWTGLIRQAHGILLPGSGADVAPHRYGHTQEPETAPADALRETLDWRLLEAAHEQQLPTLAVCFGLQSLNVYRGGTLIQHLPPMPVNHRAGRAVGRAHAAVVSASSKLGGILASADDVTPDAADGYLRVLVNSSHHQAVGAPGDGLHVSARSAEDGVIEAVEDPAHPFLLGVQWHPERTLTESGASQALVRALVEAAVRHA